MNAGTIITLLLGVLDLIDTFATRSFSSDAEREQYIETRNRLRKQLVAAAKAAGDPSPAGGGSGRTGGNAPADQNEG